MLPLVLCASLMGTTDVIWGELGFGIYPGAGQKAAPNGILYDPMFRLLANLNFGTREMYLFADSVYYTEKPQPGVTTNKAQGKFDFTKRQYDFNIGGAFALPWESTELRFWAYSESNINRGTSVVLPSGYKDGFAGSVRYYLDQQLRNDNYVALGYYFTKELVDTAGDAYKPSFLIDLNASSPWYERWRVYGHVIGYGQRVDGLEEVDTQLGFTYQFRSGKTIANFFAERDFGTESDPKLKRLLIEIRRSFYAE